jgi:putative transposase
VIERPEPPCPIYSLENSPVKKHLWGGEFWTDGNYVATVGERADWRTVERYVEKQRLPKQGLKQLQLFVF